MRIYVIAIYATFKKFRILDRDDMTIHLQFLGNNKERTVRFLEFFAEIAPAYYLARIGTYTQFSWGFLLLKILSFCFLENHIAEFVGETVYA